MRAYQDLAANAKQMFALLDGVKASKLIIDMRDNGGGDNTVGYAEIIKPVERGEGLERYQEPRQFRLPNSHLVVRASTLWCAFRKTGPNLVAPDKEIIPTWDDVKAGRDPVLDWALAQKVD